MQLLKSLLFTAYMMMSACLFGTLMALGFWLPYGAQFAIARTWARMVLWMLEHLCGLNYVVEGRERIPPGNHIVMSNHTSAWETIAQFLIFPPQVWVLKRELLWVPFVGWGLKRLRPIAINRGEGRRAVNQVIEQGKERLADGLWIIIFPEGTRVLAGETRKYGVSGALLRQLPARQIRRAADTQCGHLLAAARLHEKAGHDSRGHRRTDTADQPGSQGTQRASEAVDRRRPRSYRGGRRSGKRALTNGCREAASSAAASFSRTASPRCHAFEYSVAPDQSMQKGRAQMSEENYE